MSRILVVDDDDLIRKSCKLLLGNKDHLLSFAGNGAEALEGFDDFKPDILITDVYMPEKSGLELIGETRKRAPETRIIAISGGGQFGDTCGLVMARSLGADICLEKPLSRKTLMAALDGLHGQAPR